MQVYNVEVFDRSFACIYHDEIDAGSFSYTEDYVSYEKNTITVKQDSSVKEGHFINIHAAGENYFGIVQLTELKEDNLMNVKFIPFYSIFDRQILFDTDLQGSGISLENMLASFIRSYFVSSSDTSENIPAIGTITIQSNTTSWGFNIKSDKEDMHMAIINFYSVLAVNAFNNYGVVIECVPDLTRKKVDIIIGKIDTPVVTIETRLNSIIASDILLGKLNTDVNKLTVYNDTDYSEKRVYYLHTDGTYNRTDSDRIIPVIEKLEGVTPSDQTPFADAADSTAAGVFEKTHFDNNITIETIRDNRQFDVMSMKIGQKVRVIHGNQSINSILSKRVVGNTVKLTFGSIRVELTNLIKQGGYFNG